jgi:hypothetical protein
MQESGRQRVEKEKGEDGGLEEVGKKKEFKRKERSDNIERKEKKVGRKEGGKMNEEPCK